MITFGIDPGSHRTGWGAVRAEGSTLTHMGSGVIHAGDGTDPLGDRLIKIFRELDLALTEMAPQRVFLESLFHHKSAKSALVLGHARGVAMLAAARAGYPIGEVTPAEIKKAVTGSGRAEKAQVQEMVRILLGLPQRAQSDASDALALAIAGATRSNFDALVEAASGPKPRARRAGPRRAR